MAQKMRNGKGDFLTNGTRQTKETKMTNGGRVVQVDWEVIENTVVERKDHWSWMGWKARRERALAML